MTELQTRVHALRLTLADTVVGQPVLLDRLVMGLLCGGHVLVEGLPGLAKTTAVKTLAAAVHAPFQRLQFTPDLLPGDLTGTDVYDSHTGQFRFVAGPLFHDIILADEINRAPAKVQSALLEAMQERQITVGGHTRALPELFMVMATQNPIEQAGTYPLPQAQLDRFLLHVRLDYPAADDELRVLQLDRQRRQGHVPAALHTLTAAEVLQARHEVAQVHLSPLIETYIVALVRSTREPGQFNPAWAQVVACGASPRASLALAQASAAWAYLQGRDHVIPSDVQTLAPDVLRHRMSLHVQARFAQWQRDELIQGLLQRVPTP